MQKLSSQYLLRWLIALLVLIATGLLAIGERSVWLVILSLVFVIGSAYFTDTRKLLQLNQSLANAIALAIVCISTTHAMYLDRQGLMIAVADLQSYLQYVLLLQPKTPRVYWQLALLSLGQVAIASTLVPGPTFGALLLLYLFIGIAAFALLLNYTEEHRVVARFSDGLEKEKMSGTAARRPRIWSSAAASPVPLGRSLMREVTMVTAVTVVAMSIIFFLLPRWNVRNSETNNIEPLSSIEFSKTVTLGELGEVVNNPDLVMRAEFYTSHGTIPFKLAGEPLWRGTVVSRYQDGRWSQTLPASPVAVPTDPPSPYVRQRIKAEPQKVKELFCIFPIYALQAEPQLSVDLNFDQLIRHEDAREEQLDFELATTGISEDKQRQFLPCEFPLEESERAGFLQIPKPGDSQNDRFAGLRDAAAAVLRDRNIDPADHVAAAQALSDYFHLSGRFAYSLEPLKRDPALDPLEDFITVHPLGHCEYFAGALVIMLRSQGIPARMAIGFKGGEWNSLGSYYQVQQLHAHTWVEVYLDRKHIPESAFVYDELQPDAAWMTLDPTEGTQEAQLANHGGLIARARQLFDYANVLWINYVSGLNSKRQRQTIYEPLVQGASAAVENLVSPRVWNDRFRVVANSPVGTFWQWYRRHWFSWRGGLLAGGFSLALAAIYFGIRWGVRQWSLWRARRHQGEEPRALEIYRRLEAALGHQGFSRTPAQTAYEFAVVVGGELAESTQYRRVAHFPRRIVEMFYRVRFGGRTLDDQEVNAVEHALTELELSLARR